MVRTTEHRTRGASGRASRPAQSGPGGAALWLPSALGALAVAVTLADPAWAPATAVHGLGVLAFGASAVGLVVLLDDVARLGDADAAWQPSAWAVLAPGTAVAAVVIVVLVGRPAGAGPAFYGGVLLVAAFFSPAVVGPAYLLLRARRLRGDGR